MAVSFSYQDMDVYYICLGFVDNVMEILKAYEPDSHPLLTRLERLAVEFPLTLARIAGENEDKIPTSSLLQLRALVYECQALLEIMWRRKIIREKDADELSEALLVIANMITDISGQANTTRSIPPYRINPAL